MHAVRAPGPSTGRRSATAGRTVVVEDGRILGVETVDHPLPDGCPVTTYEGTLLPGLVEAHTHLVTDSGPAALDRVAGYTAEDPRPSSPGPCATTSPPASRRSATWATGDYCVVRRRDRQAPRPARAHDRRVRAAAHQPWAATATSWAARSPAPATIERAVAERVERGVDVVKVMASGGVNTPGQRRPAQPVHDAELTLLVDLAHAAGLPVTAHAHATAAVEQAIAAGVDGIEHCSCDTDGGDGPGRRRHDRGAGPAAESWSARPSAWTRSGHDRTTAVGAGDDGAGGHTTMRDFCATGWPSSARLHRSGVRLVSGLDSGISPGKPTAWSATRSASWWRRADGRRGGRDRDVGRGGGDRPGRAQGAARDGQDADLLVVDGDLAADAPPCCGRWPCCCAASRSPPDRRRAGATIWHTRPVISDPTTAASAGSWKLGEPDRQPRRLRRDAPPRPGRLRPRRQP